MVAGDGLEHYVDVPRYFSIIRIVQGVLSVLLLGLLCYPTNVWTTSITNAPDALAFNIFTSVWTFLVLGYAIAVPLKSPKYWNKWAALGLELLTWVFWLSAFATMADFVRKSSTYGKYNYSFLSKRDLSDDVGSIIGSFTDSLGSGGGSKYSSPSLKSGVTPWWALCAVSTAIGAIGWALWTFTLYTFAVAVKNHNGVSAADAQSDGGEKYGKAGDVEMHTQSVSAHT